MATFKEFLAFEGFISMPKNVRAVINQLPQTLRRMNPIQQKSGYRMVYVIPADQIKSLPRGAHERANGDWLTYYGIYVENPRTHSFYQDDGSIHIDINQLQSVATSPGDMNRWWQTPYGQKQAGYKVGSMFTTAINQSGRRARYQSYGV